MADIVKGVRVRMCTKGGPDLPEHQHAAVTAGEDIAAGDMVYVRNDGLIMRASGAAANAAALTTGMVWIPAKSGEPVAYWEGVEFEYYGPNDTAVLTPGARYYLGSAAGTLADAATTGGTVPVGYAVTNVRLQLFPITR